MTHKTDHFDRLEIVVAGGVAMDALIKSISGTWAHDLLSVLQVCYCIACAFIAYRDPWHPQDETRPDSLPYAGRRR